MLIMFSGRIESCPKCGNSHLERVRRDWWMKFVFQGSKKWRCHYCSTQILNTNSNREYVHHTSELS
jgi:hypothetical protein